MALSPPPAARQPIFLFMEAMQQQAQALGFDESTARTLVLQSAAGGAALAADAGDTPSPPCGKT